MLINVGPNQSVILSTLMYFGEIVDGFYSFYLLVCHCKTSLILLMKLFEELLFNILYGVIYPLISVPIIVHLAPPQRSS